MAVGDRGAVLVDLGVAVVVVVVGDRRAVLVDLGVAVIVVMRRFAEHHRARRVVVMRREVIVQRDVHPRQQLEPDDPRDAQGQRDAPPCLSGSRSPHCAECTTTCPAWIA